MPLVSVREPLDDPDWWFEPKYDGFRALAYINGRHCRLASRRGNVYKSWPYVCTEMEHAVRCGGRIHGPGRVRALPLASGIL